MASRSVRVPLRECHAVVVRALVGHGLRTDSANAIARNMVAAQRDGADSHGLFRLAGYCKALGSGKVNGSVEPRLIEVSRALLRVDAGGGFAPLALDLGVSALKERAAACGIAALQVTNSHHFAALWPEVEELCRSGLVAMAMVNSNSFVAHQPGGKDKLYGTNPMAFGWPRLQQGQEEGKGLRWSTEPVVWDQASSVMSRGDMQIAAQEGRSVPLGMGIDKHGQPSTDPSAILEGAQLPFGGHKGSNIALMIELLASGLVGGDFAFEAREKDDSSGGPTAHGELVIAIDPTAGNANSSAVSNHAETLFERIVGSSGARLPADRRYDNRRRALQTGECVVGETLWARCVEISRGADDASGSKL